MKFRVERDVLTEAVSWAARSLSPRPPVPVLSGLLLKAEAGTLSLASFDYEISARLEIAADIAEEGTILVSGRLLADICRSLPSAPVDVETDASKVTLTCRSSRFHLATMPVNDYPELPALPELSGTIDGEAFAQAAGFNPHRVSAAECRACAQAHGIDCPVGLEDNVDEWLDWLLTQLVLPVLPTHSYTLIYEYPASQCALAKVGHNVDGDAVAQRFELVYGELELANGYDELLDSDEQLARFQADNSARR